MPTLIDIGQEMTALAALLDELPDGELTPETAAALDAWFAEIEGDREHKLDGYCALIENWQLRAAARKGAAERLLRHVQADENRVKRLKERLKFFMEMTGQKKVETERYKIAVCNNGGKAPVEITGDVHAMPPQFQRVTIAPNTDVIREALEAGGKWDFARLLPRGTHLRIG